MRVAPVLVALVLLTGSHVTVDGRQGTERAEAPAMGAAALSVVPSASGRATWYRWRLGQAAAGPRLRAALGSGWRGKYVTVTAGTHRVRVRLTDYCVCRVSVVIDLDARAFRALAPLSAGIVPVVVRRS